MLKKIWNCIIIKKKLMIIQDDLTFRKDLMLYKKINSSERNHQRIKKFNFTDEIFKEIWPRLVEMII